MKICLWHLRLDKARFGYRNNNAVMKDCMVNDALWDAFNDYYMITTVDNICRVGTYKKSLMSLH